MWSGLAARVCFVWRRAIMTTGLAGGLTKPYKGMRPAALTRSESLPTASPFTGSR